ncbi:ABC transporter ATP-binding protein [Actinomyces sp. 2119]|uniref:ABC transporter ATP-binding protein n=1 Tax=Actinomyces lilanjuaniae TaxID=2321394 RepID=A0ABM6Z149_9ACTO|nr:MULTISPECIES: ABC transporter ATP-binding protein [Actinomyces]AYD88959.1 ABC transporter ATP-binding protein [Actinomyces lilanjuaniae]RJF41203.1 ABC transporter ATP-binding protein [Actinomyces sp. 2119]
MSIQACGVTRSFDSVPAVSRLSISVPSGSVTGLVGPNGAGKTTLLLMLAALLRPDSGSIRVAGLDPVTQPREVHRAVGWMPDTFGTWDSLTCTEILMTFAAAQGLDSRTARDRADQMLSLVYLSDMAHTPARVLSLGQRQRLGLARALVHSPQVLLLDEPASGMDPRSRADLRTLLRDLASQGTTVLVSSHILSELEEVVDGVIFMAHGSALAPSSPTGSPRGAPELPSEPRAGTLATGPEASSPQAGESGTQGSTVVPVPLERTWRMRALNTLALARWAQESLPQARTTPEGALRLAVADDAAAARLLRSALEAGVEVVSFAPAGGGLEEAYLSLEEERR